MSAIEVKLTGDMETIARFSRTRDSVYAAAKSALIAQAAALQQSAQRKLSGEVLSARTGRLRDSIATNIEDDGDSITASVSVGGDVPYAAIQEYGGIVHIPEIIPERARALAFEIKGEQIFAMRARAHDVQIPARSYLRSALSEQVADVEAALSGAVFGAVK